MLKLEDKIFKNLYGDNEWNIIGAKERGIWKATKEIIQKDPSDIVEDIWCLLLQITGFIIV